MVQAAHDLKLKNPFVVVRWHRGIDGTFFESVAAAMRDNATMVVYSDEVMLPALRRCGVEEPELYDYGFFGCNDPIIPAEEGGQRQLWLNLVKPWNWRQLGRLSDGAGGTNRGLTCSAGRTAEPA
jgi:formate C-acetyltransferase